MRFRHLANFATIFGSTRISASFILALTAGIRTQSRKSRPNRVVTSPRVIRIRRFDQVSTPTSIRRHFAVLPMTMPTGWRGTLPACWRPPKAPPLLTCRIRHIWRRMVGRSSLLCGLPRLVFLNGIYPGAGAAPAAGIGAYPVSARGAEYAIPAAAKIAGVPAQGSSGTGVPQGYGMGITHTALESPLGQIAMIPMLA